MRDAIIGLVIARGSRASRLAGLALAALLPIACTASERRGARVDPISVVIADFVNSTGDPVFDVSLKHALAAALGAEGLHVLGCTEVADSLRAMNLSADERVTANLAWEIAIREEIDALVLGSIERVPDGYLVTIDAVASGGGATLAHASRWAADRNAVIDALGGAAHALGRELGDVDAPGAGRLTDRLTGSIEALAQYAAGREHADRGRHAMAEPYFCRALSIDPQFEAARAALQAPNACDDVVAP
jgi:eukaryotic-like serine/threonine-protein kinase